MPLLTRCCAAIGALALACLTILAVTAAPASAASVLKVSMPSLSHYPQEPDGQRATWTVKLHNATLYTYPDTTLDIDLSERYGELPAVTLYSNDSRCTITDERSAVCHIGDLKPDARTTIDFALGLRADADRVHHGLAGAKGFVRDVNGDAVGRGKASLDASLPLDDKRIPQVKAPKQVWSTQVFGDDNADGAELWFKVRNDSADTLADATVRVTLADGPRGHVGIVPASNINDCVYNATGASLQCPMADLKPGADRAYVFTLWAKDSKAWKNAAPGTVVIDIGYIHNDHTDTWATAQAPVQLKKPSGAADDVLPVTGTSLATPFALGASALLAGALMLLYRRRLLRL
ncbi:MAG TPA: LPXTG cell wall anchor domain-containing protein [Stackebrandtia sp.]|jgi:LPXTG-motif cell wall-anchored protein|uniref:LPXTG cell wall anchor domain-containing protein n=1 Tax=Stackebrandtia sp. TaxID=2023065 RepID=UPI002D4FFFDE|nr:LPXTG cell wall anchor domain-containing protein [Stackebrandtia sp.]HZE40014.1 LPXTG cell wall anchor domain-containing protein [Stackebrandtia sp.]